MDDAAEIRVCGQPDERTDRMNYFVLNVAEVEYYRWMFVYYIVNNHKSKSQTDIFLWFSQWSFYLIFFPQQTK